MTPEETQLQEDIQSVGALDEAQGPESLTALLKSAQDARSPVRAAAMVALAARPEREAREALLRGLFDPDRLVRQFAASGVGASGGASSAQALAPLLQDPDPSVRAEALHGIARQGGSLYGGYLLTGLSDRDPVVRRTAAEAVRPLLLKLDPRPTLLALVQASHDTEGSVRWIAAWGLGELKDPAATTALEALSADPSPQVRDAARDALRKLGRGPEATAPAPAAPPPFQGTVELAQAAPAGLPQASSAQIRVEGVALGDPIASALARFGPPTYRNDAQRTIRFEGVQIQHDPNGRLIRITLYPPFFRAHGDLLDDRSAGDQVRHQLLGIEDEQERTDVNVLGAQFTRVTYRWRARGLELVITETPQKKTFTSLTLEAPSAL